ncbi:MAG: hypothetical protein ABI625_24770 [bacterium]
MPANLHRRTLATICTLAAVELQLLSRERTLDLGPAVTALPGAGAKSACEMVV